MELEGYGCRVSLDAQTLVMEGTSKAAHMALAGIEHKAGPVRLSRDQVAGVAHKTATPFVNGRVTVQATDGRSFVLHFRRKDAAAFAGLAQELAGE